MPVIGRDLMTGLGFKSIFVRSRCEVQKGTAVCRTTADSDATSSSGRSANLITRCGLSIIDFVSFYPITVKLSELCHRIKFLPIFQYSYKSPLARKKGYAFWSWTRSQLAAGKLDSTLHFSSFHCKGRNIPILQFQTSFYGDMPMGIDQLINNSDKTPCYSWSVSSKIQSDKFHCDKLIWM